MKRLILPLLLLLFLVSPVCAGDYVGYEFGSTDLSLVDAVVDELTVSSTGTVFNYNSADVGRVITIARFTLDAGESSNFTVYYGSTSVDGYVSYTRDYVKSTINWGLGDYSETFYEDYGLGWMPADAKTITITYGAPRGDGYNCTGILMARDYYPSSRLATQYLYSVSDLLNTPLYAIYLTASEDIKIEVWTTDYLSYVGSATYLSDQSDRDYIGQLLGFLSVGFSLLCELVYWFKFIFIDNFVLTFSLVEAVILFRSAQKAYRRRDPLRFFEEMFKQNKKLIDGIIGFITGIVEILHRVIDAVKPI